MDIEFCHLSRPAQTVARQAERLGCRVVHSERACSGTCYLRIEHPGRDGDLLVRVADHPANEARYQFGINEEPDVDVEIGLHAAAVRHIAEWAGVAPDSVPYLKAAATRARKAAQRAADRQAAIRDRLRAHATARAAAMDRL